jgi:Asparagine synthase
VLRTAMEGLVPDAIRLRTNKIGFVSPIHAWTSGHLNTWVRDTCASRSFLDSEVWKGRAVRIIVEQALAKRTGIERVWPIIHAHVLERAFKAQASQYRSAFSWGSPVQTREVYGQATM